LVTRLHVGFVSLELDLMSRLTIVVLPACENASAVFSFYRLLEQAIQIDHVPVAAITGGQT
jgi:hypothetical protein